MIDIHTHLLYGIDDGPASFESSVAMLEAAAADGVETIITTPHHYKGISEKLQKRLEKMRPEAARVGIELLPGCEYDFSKLSSQKELLTLGEGNYVLVDFCLSFLSPMTRSFLFEWQTRGYQIILAHPERLFNKKDLPALKDLADANIYFQLNAGSFQGLYGRRARRFARRLLKEGLCHVIASDAHSVKNYSGQLPAARKYVTKKVGEELAQIFFEDNPARLLTGKPLLSIW